MIIGKDQTYEPDHSSADDYIFGKIVQSSFGTSELACQRMRMDQKS